MQNSSDISDRLIRAVQEGNLERVKYMVDKYGLSYSQDWSDGYILLRDALRNCKMSVAKLLLTKFCKVNCRNIIDRTPLHYAVERDNITVVQMIIVRGAVINAKDVDGRTPLFMAVNNKTVEITELLLKHGADVNATDCRGKSILHAAVDHDNITVVQMIIDRGAVINAKDGEGRTPLFIAVLNNRVGIIEVLLKHGADVNETDNIRKSPLHQAVKSGCKEIMMLLLNSGANVDVKGKDDITPLHVAVWKGHYDIANVLVSHSACILSSTLSEGLLPLHFACAQGNEKMVMLFLNKGTDINASAKDKSTPLHHAVRAGHTAIVKLLLQIGANVDNEDNEGRTILNLAVHNGHASIVDCILKYLPDLVKAETIDTALHLAIAKGHVNAVNILLEHGANVEQEDQNGKKPLHLAAEKGYHEIVESLLKFGADINSRFIMDGKTALHIASENENPYYDTKVVDSLLQFGADINITCLNNQSPLDSARKRRRFKYLRSLTLRMFKLHIIKLKCASLYISRKILHTIDQETFIFNLFEMDMYQLICEEEANNMKAEMIDTNISFYNILKKDQNSLIRYMRNDKIMQVLESNEYKTTFPTYASMIEGNFRRALVKKELLERAYTMIQCLFKDLPKLPYYCTEEILSYLSTGDLQVVLNIFKSSK